MRERPLSNVPKPVILLFALALSAQLAYHSVLPSPSARAKDLPPAPPVEALQVASMGEPIAFAKLLMLRLQTFDSQPGVLLPFRTLNYAKLRDWLERILELDRQGSYPLVMASRVYGAVADPMRQRIMMDFVYRRFLEDPNHRWPFVAHAAMTAKHQLKDLPLARRYAQAIRLHASGENVPSWATQMEIFLLEDMNELEQAKILLGGLIGSGTVKDPHELNFLIERLREMEQRS